MNIEFSFISGVMLGFEITDFEDEGTYLVLDLLIFRVLLSWENAE